MPKPNHINFQALIEARTYYLLLTLFRSVQFRNSSFSFAQFDPSPTKKHHVTFVIPTCSMPTCPNPIWHCQVPLFPHALFPYALFQTTLFPHAQFQTTLFSHALFQTTLFSFRPCPIRTVSCCVALTRNRGALRCLIPSLTRSGA